jgi:hypothetical protein
MVLEAEELKSGNENAKIGFFYTLYSNRSGLRKLNELNP